MGNDLSAMEKVKCGCVIFDDTEKHATGFACIAGDEPIRIRGTQDLANDVVWITNLDFLALSQAGLSNNVRFRHDGFLRYPLPKFFRSIGVDESDRSDQARIIAHIWDDVFFLGRTYCGLDFVPQTTLQQGLRKLLWSPDGYLPDFTIDALRNAIEYWTPCERTFSGEELNIKIFQMPVYQHLEKIFTLPMPAGRWEAVQPPPKPQSSDKLQQWAAGIGKPFVAKVRIGAFDGSVNPVLNYAGGGALIEFSRRDWITSYELFNLMSVAEIEIVDVLVPESTQSLEHLLENLQALPEIINMSLSCNLFFENLWSAAGIGFAPNKSRQAGNKYAFNAFTPFIRAIDRMECLVQALELRSMGFDVFGYGTGRVYVVGADDMELFAKNAWQAARRTGLIPPYISKDESGGDVKINNQPQTPLETLQLMYVIGDNERLWQTDRQVIGVLRGKN